MAVNWKEYQEEVASFFTSLGLEASTDITIQGTRTTHNVDVLVNSHHAGFDVTWLVECKNWKRPVSKLHVLGLREIVIDVGADRGFLLSESGFQSGAIEAANLTNVRLTSLANLRLSTSEFIYSIRLRELYDRIEACRERYWAIPKSERIAHDLRQELFDVGYEGILVIDYCSALLPKAIRGTFPFKSDSLFSYAHKNMPNEYQSPQEVIGILDPLISELESKLDAYDNFCKNT